MMPWSTSGNNAKMYIFGKKYQRKCLFYFYRDEYENVAFGFVSDDMAWARKNLKNKHNDLVSTQFS